MGKFGNWKLKGKCDKISFTVVTKIVDVNDKNFDLIPRPTDKRFNCKECFYWMGKRDGRLDLFKQKKRWFSKKREKYGPLGKLLFFGKREKPVGFIQFGPVAEFQTAGIYYKDRPLPPKVWCITCVSIQLAYRGKGLGLKLVRRVLSDLKKRGVKTVDAYPLKKCRAWSQVSVGPVGLFENAGFEPLFEVKIGQNETIVMRKKLL